MRRFDWLVVLFSVAYVAVATALTFRTGNDEFGFYVAVLAILAVFIGFVHLKIRLHPLCLLGLSIWGLAHMAGGLAPSPGGEADGVLYNWWLIPGRLKYDNIVHAYGFGLSTWTVWQGLRTRLADPTPTFGLLFCAACAGMGLGALNEIVEFIAVLTIPDTNVGGYVNTGWDLVSNFTGATTAAVAIYFLDRSSKSSKARASS